MQPITTCNGIAAPLYFKLAWMQHTPNNATYHVENYICQGDVTAYIDGLVQKDVAPVH